MASAGVRAELGLQTLAGHRTSLKLGFWSHLCDASGERLLSLVFKRRHAEVLRGEAKLSGLQSMRSALVSAGLGSWWSTRACPERDEWDKLRLSAVTLQEQRAEIDAFEKKSSLSIYSKLGHGAILGPATYLHDTYNRPGVRLMTKARLGHLLLMKNLAKIRGWRRSAGACLVCRAGAIEDTRHFVMQCAGLEPCRQALSERLEAALPYAGAPGVLALARFRKQGGPALSMILGERMKFPVCPPGTDADRYRVDCGKASWIICKAAQNFLVAAWKLREAVVGRVSVQGHKLCSVPSNLDYVEEVAKQRALRVDGAALTSVRFRKQWTVWAPAAESRWQGARKSGRNGRFPFYALWRARKNGVCYCWRDAQRSIAGLPEARVRGFASEVQARQYARRMCVV